MNLISGFERDLRYSICETTNEDVISHVDETRELDAELETISI